MPDYVAVPPSFENGAQENVRSGLPPSGTDALAIARGLSHLLGIGYHIGTSYVGQSFTTNTTRTYRFKYQPKDNYSWLVIDAIFLGFGGRATVTITSGGESIVGSVASRGTRSFPMPSSLRLFRPVPNTPHSDAEVTIDVQTTGISGTIKFEAFSVYEVPMSRVRLGVGNAVVNPTTVAANFPIYTHTSNADEQGVRGLGKQARNALINVRRGHVMWTTDSGTADIKTTTSTSYAKVFAGLSAFRVRGRKLYSGDNKRTVKVDFYARLNDTATAGAKFRLTGTRQTKEFAVPTGTGGFFWIGADTYDIDSEAMDNVVIEFKTNTAGQALDLAAWPMWEPTP